MNGLRRLWGGELPLSSAFWDWAVIGGLAVNLTTTLIFVLLMVEGHAVAALILGYGLCTPYNVVVAIGVWRCAGRYEGDPRWATLARVLTPPWMALLTLL